MESDAFARQLAHELRTPLGQIEAIARLLLDRDDGGSQASEWLALQLRAARQMQQTMSCLLELARTHREALRLEEVDLSAMCELLRDEMPVGTRRAPVAWQIARGLRVCGCPQQVALLMRNLLSNAVKYTRDVSHPMVTVSAEGDGTEVFVAVQDNGVGFDDAGSARLFEPFVRLHGTAQFEGTGLGLSIAREIVARHGGWIRAKATPGCGARFEFWLAGCDLGRSSGA